VVDTGIVILAATPLGNPADASARLIEELRTADLIAAEDTRRLQRLLRDLEVTPRGRIVSMHDSVEAARIPLILNAVHEGARILVVSDAGMPAVSDPGFRLVRACIDDDVAVTVVPGPSAVLAALVVSGLPVDRFCFEGFLPRRGAERRRRLAELVDEPRTMVFFEAPHRVADALTDLVAAFGAERQGALVRELTKTYEEVRRGTLEQILAGLGEPRGEITLVIGGAAGRAPSGDPAQWAAAVLAGIEAGRDPRSAVSEVAGQYAVPRREVYNAYVAVKPAQQRK